MGGIEDWLPAFDVGERHECTLALPAGAALRHALSVPVAPDRLVRLLMRLRGLRTDGSIEEFVTTHGFLLLERTPTTWVVGLYASGGGAPATDPAAWRAARSPLSLKAAMEFRSESVPGGARLVTETRIAAGGRLALAIFRVYWLFVGPFSALIRRRWLAAARRGADT